MIAALKVLKISSVNIYAIFIGVMFFVIYGDWLDFFKDEIEVFDLFLCKKGKIIQVLYGKKIFLKIIMQFFF